MSLIPVDARIDGEIVLYGAHPRSVERLRLKLQLRNPTYESLKRFTGQTGMKTPEKLECLIDMPDGSVHLPRGTWELAKEYLLFEKDDYKPVVREDCRSVGHSIGRRSDAKGLELRDYQRKGIEEFVKHTQGLVTLPPGTGKTVLGIGCIAAKMRTTLVLVPTIDIADQWIEAVHEYGFTPGLLREDMSTEMQTSLSRLLTRPSSLSSTIPTGERNLDWLSSMNVITSLLFHNSAPSAYFQLNTGSG